MIFSDGRILSQVATVPHSCWNLTGRLLLNSASIRMHLAHTVVVDIFPKTDLRILGRYFRMASLSLGKNCLLSQLLL